MELKQITIDELDNPEFIISFKEWGENLFNIVVDGEVVGHLSLSYEEDSVTINNVMINHSYQGRGYGKEVVNILKQRHSILKGCAEEEVVPFWEKHGAIFEGEYFTIDRVFN